MITWWNPSIADHPMAGREFGTHYQLGQLNADTFIIRDLDRGGMSVTNNIENVLDCVFRSQSVMEHDEQRLKIYQLVEGEGLFRIEHEWTKAGTRNVKWIYAGPDTKALEVLYGTQNRK